MSAKQILVVDDNPDICDIIREQIVDYDFLDITPEVTIAEDGAQAVPHIKKKTFDLVVTDFMMPEMNGLDFIKTIREGNTPNQNVPVVCLSAFLPEIEANTPTHILEGVYFIEKPFNPEKLERVAKISLLRAILQEAESTT